MKGGYQKQHDPVGFPVSPPRRRGRHPLSRSINDLCKNQKMQLERLRGHSRGGDPVRRKVGRKGSPEAREAVEGDAGPEDTESSGE